MQTVPVFECALPKRDTRFEESRATEQLGRCPTLAAQTSAESMGDQAKILPSSR